MKRNTVTSELIKSVGYNPTTRTLEVRYEDSTVFQYLSVPPSVFRRLQEKNPGAWWTAHWTDYKFKQVS
jgi:hypothetical protein